jgi:hypothetical protein
VGNLFFDPRHGRENFLFFQYVQTGFQLHPASASVGTRGSFRAGVGGGWSGKTSCLHVPLWSVKVRNFYFTYGPGKPCCPVKDAAIPKLQP